MVVNEGIHILGKDQELATEPVETWVVPQEVDAQDFKGSYCLSNTSHLTELQFREEVIEALSRTHKGS